MRRLFFAFAAFIVFSLPAFAQAKRPLTFEDMMKLKRVGEPEVSPDGRWVIFSVVDVNLEANTKTPHIWIVPLEAKTGSTRSQVGMTGEREIIGDQDADRPRWAPDGKRFAFLSTKDGGQQVWVAEFDGAAGAVSAVHKLTSIASEADGELWSDVYAECDGQPDEIACDEKKLDETGKSKVKAQIFTHLLYRHWNAYKEGKRSHIFVTEAPPLVAPTAVARMIVRRYIDLTPGDYDAPVFSLGGQDNYAFSPDGQEVCYTSNHDKNPAASANNDLWLVPVNAGTDPAGRAASAAQVLALTKNITADNPASDSTPLYSPDGRYIAYRAQQRPGYESDRFRLMLYDRKTGDKKDLTEDFDHWVGSSAWSPDSRTIYFSAEHKHHSLIFAVGVAGTRKSGTEYLRRTLVAGYDDDVAVTADGKTLVFSRVSLTAPNEIYSAAATGAGCPSRTGDVDAGKEDCNLNEASALTHVNDGLLSHISMSQAQSFSFKGAHNDQVEGFLVAPPNFDPHKKYPVKFLIHGGPEGAWGDDWSYRWNAELFAAPNAATPGGYVVIMINFHGSTGYGQKFIDAINGDWGGAPYEDLMKGLDYAEKTYPFIDKGRECALGASYGGYMIDWILGHTDRFKCLVSHDGMFNAESAWGTTEELWFNDWEFKGTPYDNRAGYEKWSPHQYARNFKTPTLVIHGQRDYRLDVSEGLQLFTTLQMEGVPSEMLYFPDEGHWVLKPQNSKLWYETVNDWVDRWTKK
jgi:dipeptidyl aminopeptidase/acylaminoacyl peptidase